MAMPGNHSRTKNHSWIRVLVRVLTRIRNRCSYNVVNTLAKRSTAQSISSRVMVSGGATRITVW
jgi:hypothetical protein